MLLVYPKPMETEAKREIEEHNFSLQKDYSGRLIHDKKEVVEEHVLIFGLHIPGGLNGIRYAFNNGRHGNV